MDCVEWLTAVPYLWDQLEEHAMMGPCDAEDPSADAFLVRYRSLVEASDCRCSRLCAANAALSGLMVGVNCLVAAVVEYFSLAHG